MHQGIFLSVRTGSYNAIKHDSYIRNGRKSLRVTVLGTGWDFFIEYGGFEGGGVGWGSSSCKELVSAPVKPMIRHDYCNCFHAQHKNTCLCRD